jgi:multisubunit Na+/H+ antiporter MnhG subunit
VTPREIIIDILLALAVLIALGSSVGVLVMRDAYQKLHYVTPAAVVAPGLVGLAVLAHSGFTENSAQTGLALVFVLAGGPVLAHATIRAARIRADGDWRGSRGRASHDGQVSEAAGAGRASGGRDG